MAFFSQDSLKVVCDHNSYVVCIGQYTQCLYIHWRLRRTDARSCGMHAVISLLFTRRIVISAATSVVNRRPLGNYQTKQIRSVPIS